MYKPRKALEYLKEWGLRDSRKPLVLRGARQVGKSTIVRELGKNYDNCIELNLERGNDAKLFEDEPSISSFLERLELRGTAATTDGSTLLFLDEVQAVPQAIKMLRYFYEDSPGLHVIAAGSLLEFALGEVSSWPVGRIEFYSIHPLDFEEYLTWTAPEALVKAANKVPAPPQAHEVLNSHFYSYTYYGGMPGIVSLIANKAEKDELRRTYASIWDTYEADIVKYAKGPVEQEILKHIMRTAPFELDRISFANFGNSNYRSDSVKKAFASLDKARVIRVIVPTTSTSLPAKPDFKKRPRLQFLDTGLLNYVRGLHEQVSNINQLSSDYRGTLAHHIVTQQLIAYVQVYRYEPHFWVRENSNANAEVDLVYAFEQQLFGIEVKAGAAGRLRSLHQFVERAKSTHAIRVLDNSANIEVVTTPSGYSFKLINLPHYAIGNLNEWIRWGIV